jgi:hypothetical protein
MNARSVTTSAAFATVLCLAAAGACSSVDESSAETGAGGTAGAGGTTTSSTTTTTWTPTGDEGSSCADAVYLAPSPSYPGVWGVGVLDPAGDRDYFRLDATEGQWLALFTTGNPAADPAKINTVLTLWDESGTTQLAQNDDALDSSGADSELFFHVPSTGTYCLQIWDHADFLGQPVQGDPSFFYEVGALPIDFDKMTGFVLDSDPSPANDDLAQAQSVVLSMGDLIHLAGVLGTETDVDVYEIQLPAGTPDVQLYVPADGPSGSGSTLAAVVLTLRSADGSAVLGQMRGPFATPQMLYVPLSAGVARTYLEIERQAPALGSNDFYFGKLYPTLIRDYDTEQDDTANDLPAGAELPEQVPPTVPEDVWTVAQIMGTLTAGDLDYWSFAAEAGQALSLECGAWAYGSGLRNMHVAVSAEATPALALGAATESGQATILWSPDYPLLGTASALTLPTTGVYYLQVDLSTGSQEPTVAGDYYFCTVRTGTLTPP